MRVSIYYGTCFDRDFHKVTIANGFSKNTDVIVVKRFDHKLDITHPKLKEIYMHNDLIFTKKLSDKVIHDTEQWLEVPFVLLLKYWYNWDNSLEKNNKEMRKRYEAISKYVVFWKSFFKKYRPNVFVTTMESTFPEIVSIEVAKKLGIKVIIVNSGRIGNTFLLYNDKFLPIYWRKISQHEKKTYYESIRKRYKTKAEPESMNLSNDVNNYVDFTPFGIKNKLIDFLRYRKNYKKMHTIDKLRTLSPFQLFKKVSTGIFRRTYASFFYENFDYQKEKFIFFPLHYTDEAALSYQEAFLDQFELITKISKCLPLDVFLVVKPHPHWRCMDIPISKIKELKSNPRIKFISPDVNVYKLINFSKGVVTINSTTGFEALALDKPIITFGHDFYADPNIAKTIYDLNYLPEAIRDMIDGKLKINNKKLSEFFSIYYKHLIFIKGRMGLYVDITEEDGRAVAKNIEEYITSSKKSF